MNIRIDNCMDCPLSSTERCEITSDHMLICGHPSYNDVMKTATYVGDLFPPEPPELCGLKKEKLQIELEL